MASASGGGVQVLASVFLELQDADETFSRTSWTDVDDDGALDTNTYSSNPVRWGGNLLQFLWGKCR